MELPEIVFKVAEGNPGAARVIGELRQTTSEWETVLHWLFIKKLTGPALWAKYKDEHNHDIVSLLEWIAKQAGSFSTSSS